MRERVLLIVSQVLGVPADKVNEQSSTQNVETWDSLNHMNLIMSLEEEFGGRFSDEQIMKMLDVATILAVLAERSYVDNAGRR